MSHVPWWRLPIRTGHGREAVVQPANHHALTFPIQIALSDPEDWDCLAAHSWDSDLRRHTLSPNIKPGQ